MMKLNILHLLIAGGTLGAALALRREAGGRSLTLSRLFAAPLLALPAALLLLPLAAPDAREPTLWIADLALGLGAGLARGVTLPLHVDRLWARLRLVRARDGLWAACLLGAGAAAAFGAELVPP